MKKLLAVFAHPDDEYAVSGTLAHYASQGVEVGLVCATKGEAGEISDPNLATTDNLAEVREGELRCSCTVIGIQHLYMLDYCDSGMQGTAENEKPTAFIRAPDEGVQRKLVRIYREFKPDAIITFEPSGWYGHPDHIAAGKHASAAFHLCGSPDSFPDLGDPWQPSRLFHSVLLRRDFRKIITVARALGMDLGGFEGLRLEALDPLEGLITHTLDVSHLHKLKSRVMDCHQTQFGEGNLLRRMPPEVTRELRRFEHFIQVSPSPLEGQKLRGDLLAGLVS